MLAIRLRILFECVSDTPCETEGGGSDVQVEECKLARTAAMLVDEVAR